MVGTIARDEMAVAEPVSIDSSFLLLFPSQADTETTIPIAGNSEPNNETAYIIGKSRPSNSCIQRLILKSMGK
jgi:hypothetical protein